MIYSAARRAKKFPDSLPTTTASLWLAMALCLLSSCVTIYEPMGALQKPIVVDPRLPNFAATKIFIRCLPTERPREGLLPIALFPPNDADQLCQKVRTLFANQGAEVETSVPQRGAADVIPTSIARPDLVIDLSSRVLLDEDNTLLGILSCVTCTLSPSMRELRFAQEVIVRDGDGALLASETLKSRFVNYGGCGVWSVNAIIDLLGRSDEQDLTGDGPQRDHSRDFYGQLSQLAFNARMRARLLHNFDTKPLPLAK